MHHAPARLGTRQPSLLGSLEPALAAPLDRARRLQLDARSWVDVLPGWITGDDVLLEHLAAAVPWDHPTVRMYDRTLAQPRLSAWLEVTDPALPHPLPALAEQLGERYARHLTTVGLNLYRDGADSVAWHADRIGRTSFEPVIAVLTLGAARPFLLRPKGGGRSHRLRPAGGDLLVMGGACQHRWEHTVPKVAGTVGPRLSVTFRHPS